MAIQTLRVETNPAPFESSVYNTFAHNTVVDTFTKRMEILSEEWYTMRFAVVVNDGEYTTSCIGFDDAEERPHRPYVLARVEVDASDEDLQKYSDYCAEQARQAVAARQAAARQVELEEEEREFHTPGRGKIMQVVKGRKVPVGTIGKVIHVLGGAYGPRALLALTEEKVDGKYTNVAWLPVGHLRNVEPRL